MTCDCSKPSQTNLWTPVPPFIQPTEILVGENIDCFMQRAGSQSGRVDDIGEKLINRIDNTVLTSDLNLKVDTTFVLSPGSTKVSVTWRIWVDGNPGLPASLAPPNPPQLFFNTSTGRLFGNVPPEAANKNYVVKIEAFDAASELIDAREYNLFPKLGKKDDTIKFVFPYSPNGRVTCGFGPRKPPAAGASSSHKGIDISQPGNVLGDILAAGDGTVVKCGPARGFGNWIVIEHTDTQGKLVATTVYGHMKRSEIYVVVGQKVAAGQKIAKEGNEGVGSAAHLHFELHRGKFGNPVDPLPYINGSITYANNNLPGQNGAPDESSFKTINNTNAGITSKETEAFKGHVCPLVLPNQFSPVSGEPSFVPTSPTTLSVQQQIQQALDEDSELLNEDKKLLMFVAKIESRFKADAKNPTSSARGVFQMLDKTASVYYSKVGLNPTIENRNNAYFATKAQIRFYKDEQKKYWNDYLASGRTKINGKVLNAAVKTRYETYSQGEFIYGLIHHDGVGNAVKGKDLQGVEYWRKKIREA